MVGYSAGGVVARYWVQDLGGRAQTRRLVTLGSPHHGTEIAELGTLFAGACPVACRQLLPTSPLLGALDQEQPRAAPGWSPSGPRRTTWSCRRTRPAWPGR